MDLPVLDLWLDLRILRVYDTKITPNITNYISYFIIKHSTIPLSIKLKIEALTLKFVPAFPGKVNRYIISSDKHW